MKSGKNLREEKEGGSWPIRARQLQRSKAVELDLLKNKNQKQSLFFRAHLHRGLRNFIYRKVEESKNHFFLINAFCDVN